MDGALNHTGKEDLDELIESTRLEDFKFLLGRWCAQRQMEHLHPVTVEDDRYLDHCFTQTIGNVLEDRALRLLRAGQGTYPGDDHPDHLSALQFEVVHISEEFFEVRDSVQLMRFLLPRALLLNEAFNLLEWYAKHLLRALTRTCHVYDGLEKNPNHRHNNDDFDGVADMLTTGSIGGALDFDVEGVLWSWIRSMYGTLLMDASNTGNTAVDAVVDADFTDLSCFGAQVPRGLILLFNATPRLPKTLLISYPNLS